MHSISLERSARFYYVEASRFFYVEDMGKRHEAKRNTCALKLIPALYKFAM